MFKKINFKKSQTQVNLRELWSSMKRNGLFKEYADYDDYIKRRDVKEQMFGKREAPNPALEKLKADANQFDIDNGIDEWRDIKPSEIPF